MNKSILASLIICVALLCACTARMNGLNSNGNSGFTERITGNGIEKTKTIDENSFSDLNLSSSFEIHYIQGDKGGKIRIVGDENVLPYVKIKNEKGTLYLSFRNNVSISTKNKIRVYLSSEELKHIEISGACDFIFDNDFQAENLSVESSGACHFLINKNLQAKNISMDLSGASEIKGKGTVGTSGKLEIESSGASNIFLEGKVKSNDLRIDISGAGKFKMPDIDCYKTSVDISGAGYVKLGGKTRHLDTDKSGIARINTDDLETY